MPTKRTFDLVIIVTVLTLPVKGLFKMAAARKAMTDNETTAGKVVSGAAGIVL